MLVDEQVKPLDDDECDEEGSLCFIVDSNLLISIGLDTG
jgi:hypothetical protein